MSIHTGKAMTKARRLGAFAGDERAAPLWELSKRELIEIAIRLGSQAARAGDDPTAGIAAVNAERDILRLNGLL